MDVIGTRLDEMWCNATDEKNEIRKHGGFDEGEMKSSRQRDKNKSEKVTSEKQSIDHNVTPDQEKKGEPAAETRQK